MCDNFPESPPSALGWIRHYWNGVEQMTPKRSQASSSGVCPKGTKPKNLTEPGPNSELSHPFPRDMDSPPESRGQPPWSWRPLWPLEILLFPLCFLVLPFFPHVQLCLLSFAAYLRSSDAEGVDGPRPAKQRRAQRIPLLHAPSPCATASMNGDKVFLLGAPAVGLPCKDSRAMDQLESQTWK